jgi:hypothetical protein
MYASTWLERLFQSCQRKSTNGTLKEEQLSENQYHLLSYEQLPNFGNDALVRFILTKFLYKEKYFFILDLVLGNMGMCTILCYE